MNKKLSIIMLLSCVGNVFSMGGGAAGGNDQRPLTMAERAKAMAAESSRILSELRNKMYISATDFADTRTGAAVAGAVATGVCTNGGWKLFELAKNKGPNLLDNAREVFSSVKGKAIGFVSNPDNKTWDMLTKTKDGAIEVVKNVSNSVVKAVTDHPVSACLVGAAVFGGLGYGLYKHKEGTAAAAASRRQLEEDQDLSNFLAGGDVNGDTGLTTPLVRAVEDNNLKLVKLLIEAKADVNKKLSAGKHTGRNALFFAANWGHADIVNALLAAGADDFAYALAAAKANRDVKTTKAAGTERAGTPEEYQAVIDAIEAAKAKATTRSVAVAGGGAARSN